MHAKPDAGTGRGEFAPKESPDIGHTGHSIGTQNTRGGPDAGPVVEQYVEKTLFNIKHESLAHMHARAEAFVHYLPAEKAIVQQTDADLNRRDEISPAMQQSSWMAHVQRGAFADRDQPAETLKLRDEIAQAYRSGENFAGARVSGEATEMAAMMVRGEQGPFTFEQSRNGAEIALTGQLLSKNLAMKERAALSAERVDAIRAKDESGKPSHQTRSQHGMDLSQDPGTQVRDKMGLPVMSGTSGTSSTLALSHLQAAQDQKVPHIAPGLTEAQANASMTDLAFHYMRQGALPHAVAGGVNALREKLGAAPKDVAPEAVQTHSWPEVSAAVELSIGGRSTDGPPTLAQSSAQAKTRLDQTLLKAAPASDLKSAPARGPEIPKSRM